MIKKSYSVFAIVAMGVTVLWIYRNMTFDFLFDGIMVSSITVSVITVITNTATWILLSWASAGSKNNVKVITSQNLFMGILLGYVVAAYFSGWIGPMAGIVFGVLASSSCYGIFSIKRKILNEQ